MSFIREQIATQQRNLEKLAKMAVDGKIRGLIISGPPGLGKTHTFKQTAGTKKNCRWVNGRITPTALYQALYQCSDKSDLLILDDCDAVLEDETSINLLKAAMDTSDVRIINYVANKAVLNQIGCPDSFEFSGTVVLITNLDVLTRVKTRQSKTYVHMMALASWTLHAQVGYHDRPSQLEHVKYLIEEKGAFNEYSSEIVEEVLVWFEDRIQVVRTVDMRTAVKAILLASELDDWEEMADYTLTVNAFDSANERSTTN